MSLIKMDAFDKDICITFAKYNPVSLNDVKWMYGELHKSIDSLKYAIQFMGSHNLGPCEAVGEAKKLMLLSATRG